MKNIFFLILLFLIGGTAYSQSPNIITGKNIFTDSLGLRKLKNVNSADSVLSVDPVTGYVRNVLRSSGGSGVDSIVIHQPDSICWYDNGLETCFALGRAFDSASLNLDSTYIKFWNQGNFLDSIWLPHDNVYGVGRIHIDTYNSVVNPLSDSVVVSWDSTGIIALQNGLISGGVVSWSGSGLKYYITPALYVINSVQYSSGQDSVTLTNGDATNPRRDVITLDTTGHAAFVTGLAATPALTPQVNPLSQLDPLTVVDLDIGATVPSGVVETVIYDENTEWTILVGSGITVNPASTTLPFHLTKNADVSSWSTVTRSVSWSTVTPLNSYNYSVLKFHIRLKAAVPAISNIGVVFLNTNTGVVSSNILLSPSNGFDKNLVGVEQNISIPVSNFGFTNTFNRIYFSLYGSGSGFYLDYIALQAGIGSGNSNFITNVFKSNDSLYQVRNGVNLFIGKDSTGGGGGDGLANFYLKDSSLSGERIVSTQGFPLRFLSAISADILTLQDSSVYFNARDYLGNNSSIGIVNTASDHSFFMTTTDGSNGPYIFGSAEAGTIEYIAGTGTHLFTGPIIHNADTSTSPYNVLTLDGNNQIRRAAYPSGGGGTTIYETQTASGSTTFTFTTVPASFDDYMIFINGSHILPTTDYTVSGNDVTIPSVISGDVVVYRRIK